MKTFNDYKHGRLDEYQAPFYPSAEKIKSIVLSEASGAGEGKKYSVVSVEKIPS